MSMKTVSSKFIRLLNRLSTPYYFGFSQGHQWLSEEQVAKLNVSLEQEEGRQSVQEYERRFCGLIGPGMGKSFLTGRMAFFSLLKVLNIGPGDEVILPAFTCAVMPNAVWRCGATPVFADIDPDTLGSGAEGIKKSITSRTRLIVAQHSFGIPCQIEGITEVAREGAIFVMEDSALALDSSRDGVKVGNGGGAAVFSTDHTKPLNTLVGGFFYTRDRVLFDKIQSLYKDLPGLDRIRRQRLYKQLLFEREHHTPLKYGRSFLYKARGRRGIFFESDYGRDVPSGHDYPYPALMPAFLAQLGIFELERWEKEKERRKEILREYIRIFDSRGRGEIVPKGYRDNRNSIVPLRFAFSFPQADSLKNGLKRFLDTDQFWFQSTIIGCPDGPENLGYVPGSCPAAEKISKTIINLPCVLPAHSEEILFGLLQDICRFF